MSQASGQKLERIALGAPLVAAASTAAPARLRDRSGCGFG